MDSRSNKIAIDIGSTIIKVAEIDSEGQLVKQKFHERNFELGIDRQVEHIFGRLPKGDDVLICSSANGGLRVGIVALTSHFSGSVLRNQALLAGGNPVFVHDFDQDKEDLRPVDVLIVGGGIDCADAAPLISRLERFRADAYRFDTLIYAGNRYLDERFNERFPEAHVVPNPLGEGLRGRTYSVWHALREVYLDDLVHKEGISELQNGLNTAIRPTPEVVSRGFHRLVSNHSSLPAVGPCILLDIGGATTDLHYTVEMLHNDSPVRPPAGVSVARYVFTDLGVFTSSDTTMRRLHAHPGAYEFLACVLEEDTRDAYSSFRAGDYVPSPETLGYACLYLALHRFAHGTDPGLPVADLGRVAQIILTGGGAQLLDPTLAAEVAELFLTDDQVRPEILIDHRYQVWVEGVTWSMHPAGMSVMDDG